MRLTTALMWTGPLALAAACGGSTGGSAPSGSNAASGSSVNGGSGAEQSQGSGAFSQGSGSVVASGASAGAEVGNPSGSIAATGSAGSGEAASGAAIAASGATTVGASGANSVPDFDAGTAGMDFADLDATRPVEPASTSCPQGCNTDASYPDLTPITAAPTPIGDMTQPRKLYVENQCTYTIWTLVQANDNPFPGGVLKVAPGQAFVTTWSNGFSGRIWGRSGCDDNGKNCLQTGNDTLAEFTLTAGMASDWYDISLVDGFTIPTGIIQLDAKWDPSPSYVPGGALGADQECGSPVCALDMNPGCPASQQLKTNGTVWGCRNGQSTNGGRGTTDVTAYLKAGCPTSYTYPYDDPQSLFLCLSAAQNNGVGSKDYKVIYCPTQGATPGFP